jgi:hypothetical protein
VSWFADGRFGVSHAKDTAPNDHPAPFSYRSVRVPKHFEGGVYVMGERIDALLCNFSQRGLGMRLRRELPIGTPATLKCGNRYLEGASVRWSRDGVAGFHLPKALSVPEMEELALVA